MTFAAAPQPVNDQYFGDFTNNERIWHPNVFQIVVKASVPPRNDAFPTSQVVFPAYLANLLDDTPSRAFEVALSGSTIVKQNGGMLTTPDMGVNGEPWHGWEDPVWTANLCKDRLYRITVRGAHPYHQHINHFQVHTTQAPEHIVRRGEFRDVVLGGFHGSHEDIEVLYMKTFDYDGVYILHCHIVEHEDGGLMGGYLVSETCNDDAPEHCARTEASNASVCTICDEGYTLKNGACYRDASVTVSNDGTLQLQVLLRKK